MAAVKGEAAASIQDAFVMYLLRVGCRHSGSRGAAVRPGSSYSLLPMTAAGSAADRQKLGSDPYFMAAAASDLLELNARRLSLGF